MMVFLTPEIMIYGYSSKTAILSKRVVLLLSNNEFANCLKIVFAILAAEIVPK